MATTSGTDFQRSSSVDEKTLCGCGGCARRSHALLTSERATISSCENRFGGGHMTSGVHYFQFLLSQIFDLGHFGGLEFGKVYMQLTHINIIGHYTALQDITLTAPQHHWSLHSTTRHHSYSTSTPMVTTQNYKTSLLQYINIIGHYTTLQNITLTAHQHHWSLHKTSLLQHINIIGLYTALQDITLTVHQHHWSLHNTTRHNSYSTSTSLVTTQHHKTSLLHHTNIIGHYTAPQDITLTPHQHHWSLHNTTRHHSYSTSTSLVTTQDITLAAHQHNWSLQSTTRHHSNSTSTSLFTTQHYKTSLLHHTNIIGHYIALQDITFTDHQHHWSLHSTTGPLLQHTNIIGHYTALQEITLTAHKHHWSLHSTTRHYSYSTQTSLVTTRHYKTSLLQHLNTIGHYQALQDITLTAHQHHWSLHSTTRHHSYSTPTPLVTTQHYRTSLLQHHNIIGHYAALQDITLTAHQHHWSLHRTTGHHSYSTPTSLIINTIGHYTALQDITLTAHQHNWSLRSTTRHINIIGLYTALQDITLTAHRHHWSLQNTTRHHSYSTSTSLVTTQHHKTSLLQHTNTIGHYTALQDITLTTHQHHSYNTSTSLVTTQHYKTSLLQHFNIIGHYTALQDITLTAHQHHWSLHNTTRHHSNSTSTSLVSTQHYKTSLTSTSLVITQHYKTSQLQHLNIIGLYTALQDITVTAPQHHWSLHSTTRHHSYSTSTSLVSTQHYKTSLLQHLNTIGHYTALQDITLTAHQHHWSLHSTTRHHSYSTPTPLVTTQHYKTSLLQHINIIGHYTAPQDITLTAHQHHWSLQSTTRHHSNSTSTSLVTTEHHKTSLLQHINIIGHYTAPQDITLTAHQHHWSLQSTTRHHSNSTSTSLVTTQHHKTSLLQHINIIGHYTAPLDITLTAHQHHWSLHSTTRHYSSSTSTSLVTTQHYKTLLLQDINIIGHYTALHDITQRADIK
ncbi:uncharacterized protein LOC121374659 [Gigantopelta aegis]|uniref:uncharacterized protein LOC121374659 n=1 Tax=Gigantopelta aegis TaxID=1735272 RepID=UPI001B88C772|nr:uncharacterized protein LOC121374659 [Gigantopelta aegis]